MQQTACKARPTGRAGECVSVNATGPRGTESTAGGRTEGQRGTHRTREGRAGASTAGRPRGGKKLCYLPPADAPGVLAGAGTTSNRRSGSSCRAPAPLPVGAARPASMPASLPSRCSPRPAPAGRGSAPLRLPSSASAANAACRLLFFPAPRGVRPAVAAPALAPPGAVVLFSSPPVPCSLSGSSFFVPRAWWLLPPPPPPPPAPGCPGLPFRSLPASAFPLPLPPVAGAR